jgi:two-component sensor histidine kinase
VQALASQTLHSISPQERDAFLARLRALGTAHDVLTQRGWSSAPAQEIIDRALEPFAPERITTKGPNVLLDASKALMLTMAMHELATNASEYGALSSRTGTVSIEWTLRDAGEERSIQLRWLERGGPPVKAPSQKGFGSRLIENSFEAARMDYASEGFACAIEIKV